MNLNIQTDTLGNDEKEAVRIALWKEVIMPEGGMAGWVRKYSVKET
jgi:hypothetical protein